MTQLTISAELGRALRDRARELGVTLATIHRAAQAAVVDFLDGLDPEGSWADLATSITQGRAAAPYNLSEGLDLGCADGPEQAARYAGYHVRALEWIARDPAARRVTSALMGAEEERTLRGFSGPDVPLPPGTYADLFDLQAQRTPGRTALVCGGERLTYAMLDAESERFAAHLDAAGVKRGDVVTTLMHRGVAWAVTVLALLKLGAVYLPQDPDYPAGRLASVLRRSRCRHVVVESGAPPALRATSLDLGLEIISYGEAATTPHPATRLPRPAQGDPAYLIFTSGSTGEPKGALIRHRGLLNHLLAKERDLELDSEDRVAQIATQCFDISIWQLLVAWLSGATTHLYTRYDILDVPGFLRSLTTDRITILEVVPSYLDLLIREADSRPVELATLRLNLVTGEPLPPDLTRRWFARYPAIPLVNAYGPTEASDDVTHHRIDGPVTGTRVPVGRAVINTGLHVVGPGGLLRPMGGYGEICVTGAGVGLGYVNDDERTAAVFRPNTLDERSPALYRTGDIGRWLPGGVLDCAGRGDDQVKVRGYRIELSDIDAALVRLPGVQVAVTLAHVSGAQRRLVSYYVGAAEPELPAFHRGLAELLPAHMHPEKVVRLESFPLTNSGKIDRRALKP